MWVEVCNAWVVMSMMLCFIFSDVAAEMCLCFECLCLNVGLN